MNDVINKLYCLDQENDTQGSQNILDMGQDNLIEILSKDIKEVVKIKKKIHNDINNIIDCVTMFGSSNNSHHIKTITTISLNEVYILNGGEYRYIIKKISNSIDMDLLHYMKENTQELIIPMCKIGDYYIYDYIDGTHMPLMNQEQAKALGRSLAKIHRIPMQKQPLKKLDRQYNVSNINSDEYKKIDEVCGGEYIDVIKMGYNIFKKIVAPKNVFDLNSYVHNDFHLHNVLFTGNTISGIIDIENCGIGNSIYEFYLGLFNCFTVLDLKNAYKIDINENMGGYIESYIEETNLQIDFNTFLYCNLYDLYSSIKLFINEYNETLLKINVYKLFYLLTNIDYYKMHINSKNT